MENFTVDVPVTTAHIILQGTKDLTRHRYNRLRHSLHSFLGNQLSLGRQITLQLDGVDDKLRRVAKWREFSSVNRSQTLFSTIVDTNAAIFEFHSDLIQDDGHVKVNALFELGDHADNSIQQEGLKRKKSKPCEPGTDDCGDNASSIDIPEEFSQLFHCTFDEQSEGSETSDPAIHTSTFQYIANSRRSFAEDELQQPELTTVSMTHMLAYLTGL